MYRLCRLLCVLLVFNEIALSQTPLYSIGNTVQVGSQTLNVRAAAAGSFLGTQPPGQTGVIINGPTIATLSGISYVWYDVNWQTGVDGWSVQDGVSLVTPQAPSLISPGNGSSPGPVLTSTTQTFSWSSVSAAASYGLYIRDLNTNVLSQYIINAPTTSSTQTLTDGHSYRWNMQAFNGTASSSITGDYYFQINSVQSLSPPALVSPIYGQIVNVATSPGSVSLSWNSVSGATGYQLNIDGSWVTISNGAQTTYSATLNAGSHEWQARTENSAGAYGSWSSYQSFSVQVTQIAMLVTPNSVLDFGNISVGQSGTLGITFTNEAQSTANLVIGSNPPTAPFQIVNGQSLSLPPGSSSTLNFTFTPTAAGPASQSWTFTDNATNWGSPWPITLQGYGVGSATLGKGARVIAGEDNLPVRDASLTTILFKQVAGVHGTITGDPVYTDGSNPPYYKGNWWQIQWDSEPPSLNNALGWSAESYIALAPLSGDIPEPDFTSSYFSPVNGNNSLSQNIFVRSGEAPTATPEAYDFSSSSLGNCTWYVYGRMLQLGFTPAQLASFYNAARDWATDANGKFPVNSTPSVHCIAQSVTQNHVAVVESVNGDGTITVTESAYVPPPNSSSAWNFRWRHRTVSPSWFQNFIHISDASLAVQLSSFTGSSSTDGVRLTWKTQSETNNAGFILLRKTNLDSTFREITGYLTDDSLRGVGTSPSGKEYTYTDNRVSNGNVYTYELESVSLDGATSQYAQVTIIVDMPKEYALYQNYPNPFNPSTTIRFDLKETSTVTLDIYNVLGQRILDENYGTMNAGSYNEDINMAQYASGVYIYRITATGNDGQRFVSVRKLVLIK